MFGLNTTGWLALHHQEHARLVAEATVPRPLPARPAPATVPGHAAAVPVCATC